LCQFSLAIKYAHLLLAGKVTKQVHLYTVGDLATRQLGFAGIDPDPIFSEGGLNEAAGAAIAMVVAGE
jgi:hypothetical protein